MNESVDQDRRRKQAAIIGMLGVSLVTGIVATALAPDAANVEVPMSMQLMANLALLLLGFRWLQIDSAQLDIRRPLWLNIGIILLAAVFVPYYFYKTRPPGQRATPILSFFGLVIACAMASVVGTALMASLQPGSPSPATF